MAPAAADPTHRHYVHRSTEEEDQSINIVDYLRSPADPLAQGKLPRRPLLCNISRDDTTLIAVDCLGDKRVHRIPLPEHLRGLELFSSVGHCLLFERRYRGPPSGIRLFNPFSSSSSAQAACLPPSDSLMPTYSSFFHLHRVLIDPKRGIALALGGDSACRLAYSRLACSRWIDLTHLVPDNDFRFHFQSALLYKGVFYAVDDTGTKVFALDLSSLDDASLDSSATLVDITLGLPDNYKLHHFKVADYCCYQSASLVTSDSSLFLVRWRTTLWKGGAKPSREIDVFRLDHCNKEWVPVKSLGDHSFFIGDNLAFSLSAVDFPALKGNRVYLCSDADTPISGNQFACNYYDDDDDRDDFLHHLVHDLEDGSWDVFYDGKSPSQNDYHPPFWMWMLPPAV